MEALLPVAPGQHGLLICHLSWPLSPCRDMALGSICQE